MHRQVCPHCGKQRLATARVPKDVVVVLPCPSCHEWVVMFRGKAIALSREIIVNGSFEEKKDHIAEIIAEFLEPGMFPSSVQELEDFANGFAQQQEEGEDEAGEEPDEQEAEGDEPAEHPISQRELDDFVRVELDLIDDPSYFRRHFGN